METEVLGLFPEVDFAFAYGSGVKHQVGYEKAPQNTMIDLILAVEKPEEWHRENLDRNHEHYSLLGRIGGPKVVAKLQDNYGARIYFNTMVRTTLPNSGDDLYLKYGVISTDALLDDLNDWSTLYTSGRLHKPVTFLRETPPAVESGLSHNISSAISAALLLLPDSFTEEQLYFTIAGLSYAGDVRMGLAENPNKVGNIVIGNLAEFKAMYRPHLQSLVLDGKLKSLSSTIQSETTDVAQFTNLSDRNDLAFTLPNGLVQQCTRIDDVHQLADPVVLKRALASVVRRSSTTQTLKGILSAGATKSILYAASKIGKRIKA